MSVHEKMTAIANRIRQFGGGDGGNLLNLDQIADGVEQVYDNGYYVGNKAGKEQGKQEQYDAFWDVFQQKGARTNYNYCFMGTAFDESTFYPKYKIAPTGYAQNVFFSWNTGDRAQFNLKQRLIDCNVELDTSGATNISGMFNYPMFTEIPTINCSSLSGSSTNVFANGFTHLDKIEKIITKETVTYSGWFTNTYLKEVYFDGVIGQSIDFRSCNLIRASIEDIVKHLSTASSGMTVTFKKTAVEAAFTTAEFEALKAPITNWTFSLV